MYAISDTVSHLPSMGEDHPPSRHSASIASKAFSTMRQAIFQPPLESSENDHLMYSLSGAGLDWQWLHGVTSKLRCLSFPVEKVEVDGNEHKGITMISLEVDFSSDSDLNIGFSNKNIFRSISNENHNWKSRNDTNTLLLRTKCSLDTSLSSTKQNTRKMSPKPNLISAIIASCGFRYAFVIPVRALLNACLFQTSKWSPE